MKFSKEPNLRREPPLSQQVAVFLTEEIKEGNVRPGEPLPSEAELSYRFNVSRPVIREALSILKHQGLLESKQGGRTKVVNGLDFPYQINTQDMTSAKETAGIYELKIMCEGDAAALAALRVTSKELKALKAILDRLARSLQKGEGGTSANVDFHQTMINAGRNNFLTSLINYINEKLWDVFDRDDRQSNNLPLTRESLEEHRKIYQAIADRNPERAREALYDHLISAARRRGIPVF
jgi:GntR family transcriptional repressor for pyruvate dehydrogenase complex